MCQNLIQNKWSTSVIQPGVKKSWSNLPVSKSALRQLRKLPINQITTVECTQKINTTKKDKCGTHYGNYDRDIIDDSAPRIIVENELSQQKVRFKYSETFFCNNRLTLNKVYEHNGCDHSPSVLRDGIQLLPKLLTHYKSMKEVELYWEKQLEEKIKLNGLQPRRFQTLTGLFMKLYAKSPETVFKNQMDTVTEDRCITEPIPGRVYSHPTNSKTGIRAARTLDEHIKNCADRNINWKDMETDGNSHFLPHFSCSVKSPKSPWQLVHCCFIHFT